MLIINYLYFHDGRGTTLHNFLKLPSQKNFILLLIHLFLFFTPKYLLICQIYVHFQHFSTHFQHKNASFMSINLFSLLLFLLFLSHIFLSPSLCSLYKPLSSSYCYTISLFLYLPSSLSLLFYL